MAKETKMVTISNLAEEFELEGREIRIILRKAGFKAPETKQEGFGPRAKYEWPEGSDELKKVKKAIEDATDDDEDEKDDKKEDKKEDKKTDKKDDKKSGKNGKK